MNIKRNMIYVLPLIAINAFSVTTGFANKLAGRDLVNVRLENISCVTAFGKARSFVISSRALRGSCNTFYKGSLRRSHTIRVPLGKNVNFKVDRHGRFRGSCEQTNVRPAPGRRGGDRLTTQCIQRNDPVNVCQYNIGPFGRVGGNSTFTVHEQFKNVLLQATQHNGECRVVARAWH